jgi:hypothetical protein
MYGSKRTNSHYMPSSIRSCGQPHYPIAVCRGIGPPETWFVLSVELYRRLEAGDLSVIDCVDIGEDGVLSLEITAC